MSIKEMSIEELKRKIKELEKKIEELDGLLDDESISDEQFIGYSKEAAALTQELGQTELRLNLISVDRLENLNEWYKNFLDSFVIGTRKVTIKQAQIFQKINRGKPFIHNGKRFDCESPNYRNGFSCLEVRAF